MSEFTDSQRSKQQENKRDNTKWTQGGPSTGKQRKSRDLDLPHSDPSGEEDKQRKAAEENEEEGKGKNFICEENDVVVSLHSMVWRGICNEGFPGYGAATCAYVVVLLTAVPPLRLPSFRIRLDPVCHVLIDHVPVS